MAAHGNIPSAAALVSYPAAGSNSGVVPGVPNDAGGSEHFAITNPEPTFPLVRRYTPTRSVNSGRRRPGRARSNVHGRQLRHTWRKSGVTSAFLQPSGALVAASWVPTSVESQPGHRALAAASPPCRCPAATAGTAWPWLLRSTRTPALPNQGQLLDVAGKDGGLDHVVSSAACSPDSASRTRKRCRHWSGCLRRVGAEDVATAGLGRREHHEAGDSRRIIPCVTSTARSAKQLLQPGGGDAFVERAAGPGPRRPWPGTARPGRRREVAQHVASRRGLEQAASRSGRACHGRKTGVQAFSPWRAAWYAFEALRGLALSDHARQHHARRRRWSA